MGKYIVCANAGLASEPRAVGRSIGKLLDDLDRLDSWALINDGCDIRNDLREMRAKLRDGLLADGWRIKVNSRDQWTVLPPK